MQDILQQIETRKPYTTSAAPAPADTSANTSQTPSSHVLLSAYKQNRPETDKKKDKDKVKK
jgi:hypothetical protein